MERRDFLTGAAALMATLTAEPAFAGPSWRSDEPLEAWLDRLDTDLARMRTRLPAEPIRRALRGAGIPETFGGEALATLSLILAWRSRSDAEKAHPGFEPLMARALGDLPGQVALVLDRVERMPRRLRRALGKALRRPARVHALLDKVLIRKEGSPERRRALRGALGNLAATLRKVELGELIGGLGRDFDEAAASFGLDRPGLIAAYTQSEDRDGDGVPDDAPPSASPSRGGGWTPAMRFGGILALVGVGVEALSLGTLALMVGVLGVDVFIPITALGCFVIGPLCLIIGLLTLIIAAIVNAVSSDVDSPEAELVTALFGPELLEAATGPPRVPA